MIDRESKRVKLSEESSGHSVKSLLAKGLLEPKSIENHAASYSSSTPYKHSLISQLFQDDLVRKVRQEIKSNLVFTEKETDIYKVKQTGDLANLDGLEGEELSKLGQIAKLRNALYSPEFRDFLRKVTGVGPLSGKKIDMSINNYTQGCHLLNHDDVIGTRSVSYILYLPDPDEDWKPEYGGALELYPVKEKGVPENTPSSSHPPSWNQFIMFAVQPGHSFHSVEEVVHEGKERLSISGWFHVAQEGEEGYIPNANNSEAEDQQAKSTLEQLLANDDSKFDDYKQTMAESQELSDDDKAVLGEVMNLQYLDLRTLLQVNEKFCEDSHIQLSEVLNANVAAELKDILITADNSQIKTGMKSHDTGVGEGWEIQGPPHRHRFMTTNDVQPNASCTALQKVRHCLRSNAFRKWLALVTSLVPTSRHVLVRRFRPGLDYTLARSNSRHLIDVNFCLTPPSEVWEEGEVGGYNCFMAPHDDEDAAVYKATAEDEDDGVLLTANAAWNEMTIVMRDPGILSFTKYVSARAGSSRWDVTGAFTVEPDEDDED